MGSRVTSTIIVFLFVLYGRSEAQICDDNAKNKSDCGWLNITEQQCKSYNCCWAESGPGPVCYHKIFVPPVYTVVSKVETKNGWLLILQTQETTPSKFGTAITPIKVSIYLETEDRLRIKILDPNYPRWEIPTAFVPGPDPPANKPANTNYMIETSSENEVFWFAVQRGNDKEVLFNTSVGNGLQFYNQYLEIGTQLPTGYNLYGLGEQVRGFRLNRTDEYTLWNFDVPTPYHKNVYGSHPFYLDHRLHSGKSHGVFLRNSNGMDIITTPNSLTYKVIGGILDLYFFMGPDPEMVVSQYLDLIGRPAVPPYWSLGFHQCRWGYKDIQVVEEVVANYSKADIPLETIWNDIDYMDEYKDFTLDPKNYPQDKVKTFVDNLQAHHQHYVVIIDPGIAKDLHYAPYSDGVELDVFIKNWKGEYFTGKVWPGFTVYPDFISVGTQNWWGKHVMNFMNMIPVDGLWIDMNEVSNFCNGECNQTIRTRSANLEPEFFLNLDHDPQLNSKSSTTDAKFGPTNPPYAINNQNDHLPLKTKTLDMNATHNGGILAYDAHNLYGLTESMATYSALLTFRQKQRPFVLSRSTFAGSGAYAAHWTGDNCATWDDMYLSIPDMLNFQLFGVPFVGSDICGFNGDTTEQLCGRWMALGSFYPFSRNHNTKSSHVPQEAYRWDSVASIARKMILTRYSLLPYMYTQFVLTNKGSSFKGHSISTVVKPLFFQFPLDAYAVSIDKQFFFGPSLMVSPVLNSTNEVNMYFPAGRWYDWFTRKMVVDTQEGVNKTFSVPMDTIPIHILGGHIITTEAPGMTIYECREGTFLIIIALDTHSEAEGRVYIDDGITLDTKEFLYIRYVANPDGSGNGLVVTASVTKGNNDNFNFDIPALTQVTILGLKNAPKNIEFNGNKLDDNTFQFSDEKLTISLNKVSMEEEWNMKILDAMF